MNSVGFGIVYISHWRGHAVCRHNIATAHEVSARMHILTKSFDFPIGSLSHRLGVVLSQQSLGYEAPSLHIPTMNRYLRRTCSTW
jgi:hypothetical protein